MSSNWKKLQKTLATKAAQPDSAKTRERKPRKPSQLAKTNDRPVAPFKRNVAAAGFDRSAETITPTKLVERKITKQDRQINQDKVKEELVSTRKAHQSVVRSLGAIPDETLRDELTSQASIALAILKKQATTLGHIPTTDYSTSDDEIEIIRSHTHNLGNGPRGGAGASRRTATAEDVKLMTTATVVTDETPQAASSAKKVKGRGPPRADTLLPSQTAAANSNEELSTTQLHIGLHFSELNKQAEMVVTDARKSKPGKFLAMDCEMVGVGPDGSESALGRISLVNFFGHTIYDRYVRPIESVTDYRTEVSGITPELLEDAPDFASVQREVASLLKSRVVVGHDLDNDFKVLMFGHPQESRRDTSKYPPLVKLGEGKRPSLKQLAATLLNLKIQTKAHSSVQDAQVAMLLYRKFKVKWDSVLLRKNKPGTENKSQVKV